MRLLRFLSIAAPLALLSVAPAAAQGLSFSALEGHSIVSEYQEAGMTRMGPFQQTWRDRIYFSTQGRIFHRISVDSPRPGQGKTREMVGDEQGVGQDRGAKFAWNGSGVSRQWTNQRGIQIRQSITISPTGGGYACRMTVERFGGGGYRIGPVGQSCRVVKGNILATS